MWLLHIAKVDGLPLSFGPFMEPKAEATAATAIETSRFMGHEF